MITTQTQIPTSTTAGRRFVPRARIFMAISLIALGALSLGIDMPICRWLSSAQLPGDLRKLLTYSEVFGHGLGVLLIAMTASLLDPRKWRVGVFLLINALGAGLLADVGKVFIGRFRPAHCPSMDIDVTETFLGWFPAATYPAYSGWFDPRYASFPSAHAATAAGLAVGLSILYPRGRWLFAFFALLAGIQRCYSHSHFLSDVYFGFAVGLLWTVLVGRFWPNGYPREL